MEYQSNEKLISLQKRLFEEERKNEVYNNNYQRIRIQTAKENKQKYLNKIFEERANNAEFLQKYRNEIRQNNVNIS